MKYLIRIELWCGSDETPDGLHLAEERYRKADKIAKKFDINTYFEVHEEKEMTYADGYLYPHSGNVLDVLEALDASEVEYDNIDIPEVLKGSQLYKDLIKRYPQGMGVSVNLGEIGVNNPERYTPRFRDLYSRGRGWHNESARHSLARRGIRMR